MNETTKPRLLSVAEIDALAGHGFWTKDERASLIRQARAMAVLAAGNFGLGRSGSGMYWIAETTAGELLSNYVASPVEAIEAAERAAGGE